MTGSSPDYVAFIKEQLSELPEITSGRFFGGTALSAAGVQFAMTMGNTLYFVVNDSTRPNYERMGSGCFWYTTKKGRVDVKKYYEVPGELLEDQPRLLVLAREAMQAARTAKAK